MNCLLLRAFTLLLSTLICTAVSDASDFRIAAASSLQFALREVVDEYTSQTGKTPALIFGSSGNLYRQIQQGAPFDVFFSARSELAHWLFDSGTSSNVGDRFGTGRLVLLSGNQLDKSDSLEQQAKSIVASEQNKLAIANPVHAPYGRAAKQALESLDLWQQIKPHLVYGEQVSQATRFVVSGSVSYGLTSLSLALSPTVSADSQYHLVDESLYEPIELQMVLLGAAGSDAHAFYQFVLHSDAVDDIFRRYGMR